ncbi:hypothetical protein QA640_01105 [Bradyrhizobium sp. CB82]|uniref:hypothetical protein n=1 Tax=Bradyrhizobium sp. CB82 TaxID=3039159 RepID=UPI0024B1A1E9|nr:hypothetical protein [Bradyrhizobium sp. CB82]WFU41176.1 hypothetical protein QA640_01105 [Bradyrhizobium sp. CB82]
MAVALRRAATMAAPIGLLSAIALVDAGARRDDRDQHRRHRPDDRRHRLVLMMTIPGLALSYSGMVRNVVHLSAGTGTRSGS